MRFEDFLGFLVENLLAPLSDAIAPPPRRVKAKRADKIVVQEKKTPPARVYTFNDYKDVLSEPDELIDDERES